MELCHRVQPALTPLGRAEVEVEGSSLSLYNQLAGPSLRHKANTQVIKPKVTWQKLPSCHLTLKATLPSGFS